MPKVPAKITDHLDDASNRLTSQFDGKTGIANIMSVYFGGLQALEDALYNSLLNRFIDTAEGKQLDTIGKIIGQKRESATDAVFKQYLRARALANRSNGTVDELLRIISLATGEAITELDFIPHTSAKATIRLLTVAISESTAVIAAGFVRDAKSGGERYTFEAALTTPSGLFKWDVGPGWDSGRFVPAYGTE